MRGEGRTGRGVGELLLPPDTGPGPEDRQSDCFDPAIWSEQLRDALAERSPDMSGIAEQAVRTCPADPELLLLASRQANQIETDLGRQISATCWAEHVIRLLLDHVLRDVVLTPQSINGDDRLK